MARPKRSRALGWYLAARLRRTPSTHAIGARIRSAKTRIAQRFRAVETQYANRVIPKPKISPRRIAQFWKDYDAGKRRSVTRHMDKNAWNAHAERTGRRQRLKPWFDQQGLWRREPLSITPSIEGVVRNFVHSYQLEEYVSATQKLEQLFRKNPFFDYQPVHILSIQPGQKRILEMVVRAPTAVDVFDGLRNNIYAENLKRRLARKKVDLNKEISTIQDGVYELRAIVRKNGLDLDDHNANILVVDYDPAAKKPLLALIDHRINTLS